MILYTVITSILFYSIAHAGQTDSSSKPVSPVHTLFPA
jgi:hypothetical protein